MSQTVEGVVYSAPKQWNSVEESILEEHWGKMPEDDLVKLLNRPLVLIKRKAKALGLLSTNKWSAVEIGRLGQNHCMRLSLLKASYFKDKTYEQIVKKRQAIMERPFIRADFLAELTENLNTHVNTGVFVGHACLPTEGDMAILRDLAKELYDNFNKEKLNGI